MFWNISKDDSQTDSGMTWISAVDIETITSLLPSWGADVSLWSVMMMSLPLMALTMLLLSLMRLVSGRTEENNKDLCVVVTGASRGIGRHIALQYAERKARLVITATNERLLINVAKECRELGSPEVFIFAQKLGGRESAKELMEFSKKKLGKVDSLVLNHVLLPSLDGNSHWKEEKDFEELETKTLVNYLSYVYIASYFRNILETSGGKICIVSSIAAQVPMFKSNTYAAAKAALNAFFLSYREELLEQNSNITICQVFLGLVSTESITGAIGKVMNNVDALMNNVFMRQFVLPPRVAAARVMKAAESRTETTHCPSKTLLIIRLLYFIFSDYFLKFFRVVHQESEKQVLSESDS